MDQNTVELDDSDFISAHEIDFTFSCAAAIKSADLLYLGDSNHFDLSIRSLALSEKTLKAVAESGVSHICLEIGKDRQDLISQIDVNVKTDNEIIKQITRMKALGMSIHCVDPELESEKEKGPIGKFYKEGSLSTEDRKKADQYLDERFSKDLKLAKNIRHAIPEGEKGILFYGCSHGAKQNDGIGESDGNISTIQIEIYPDLEAYSVVKAAKERLVEGNIDLPEAIYFMKSGTLILTKDAPEEFRKDITKMSSKNFENVRDIEKLDKQEQPKLEKQEPLKLDNGMTESNFSLVS